MTVRGDQLSFRLGFRRYDIKKASVREVELRPVASLFDEIGAVLHAQRDVFVTDATEGFSELTDWLAFDSLFGPDWATLVEEGNVLTATLGGIAR